VASLTLNNGVDVIPGTLIAGGIANFTVDPTGVTERVELWERSISFAAPGPVPPPPDFVKIGLFGSTTSQFRKVPLAALYQARLYREGEGNKAGDGPVLDRLDMPCLLSDEQGSRLPFLTACADKPQIEITAGGTFVSLDFAAQKRTMARVQLALGSPKTFVLGKDALGIFGQGAAIATTFSGGPKLLHKLALIDEAMLPGTQFFFVILAWDEAGKWDYVWDPDAAAPKTNPKKISTKQRFVDVRLTKLHYLDDSDGDLTGSGEGDFTLVVEFPDKVKPGKEMRKSLNVPTFKTGTSLTITPPTSITIGPEVVALNARKVNVKVEGHDDDGGGLGTDDDDFVETPMTPLDFPVGEGKEEVTNRLLSLKGDQNPVGDDDLRFTAEVVYSVTYS
jgi:hypothetical protein